MKRIGVFVCHCGINIAGAINTKKVVEEIKKYPGVAYATDYIYVCSDPGQNLIKERIKEEKLDAVIVAACSPSLHEQTFRNTVALAGLNPYQMESANIREQVSWVHPDKEVATQKAIQIIKSLVEKIILNEDLTPFSIPVTRRAMVIGGGISGIQTALDIANSGYEVILVEKEPSIGGHMIQLSETFPTLDCSQCIMTPKMVEVNQHPNIKLLAHSEVEEVSGYIGNFKIKVRKKARFVDEEKCTACGDCWNSCPVRNHPQILEIPSVRERMKKEDILKLDSILDRYKDGRGELITILQDINEEYNWLPQDALTYVAERLEIPISQVYEIATFFTAFSLEPRGRYLIKICMGTACFVRGAPRILSEIERKLGIRPGETTPDGMFTLETVNCLGACALGPLMVVGKDYHGRMDMAKVSPTIKIYEREA